MISVPIPTLQTVQVTLRPWNLEDAPRLLEIMQEAEIFKYFPPSTPPTLEKAERYISHQLSHWQKYGYGHWAVTTPAEGQVVGWDGLEFLPETQETEVAYLLSRSARGKGIATEAAQAAVDFGFRSAGLASIIGLVHPENGPSLRVLEKSGLRYIDNKVYFGMEMRRYRIEKGEFDEYRKGLEAEFSSLT